MQLIFAQQMFSISGTVINVQGLPIENVSVKIEDLDIGSTTDASGYFLLQFPDPGSYEVTFNHIG